MKKWVVREVTFFLIDPRSPGNGKTIKSLVTFDTKSHSDSFGTVEFRTMKKYEKKDEFVDSLDNKTTSFFRELSLGLEIIFGMTSWKTENQSHKATKLVIPEYRFPSRSFWRSIDLRWLTRDLRSWHVSWNIENINKQNECLEFWFSLLCTLRELWKRWWLVCKSDSASKRKPSSFSLARI